jgi:hypothetical protein
MFQIALGQDPFQPIADFASRQKHSGSRRAIRVGSHSLLALLMVSYTKTIEKPWGRRVDAR